MLLYCKSCKTTFESGKSCVCNDISKQKWTIYNDKSMESKNTTKISEEK